MVPNGPKPKGAIFLSAGFDASEWESDGMQRHKVNVPTEFYARLTRDVVKIAAEEGSAVDGRIISVLEGGYSDRALCTGVFSHLSGLAGGDPITIAKEFKIDGLGYEIGNKIGIIDGLKKEEEPISTSAMPYDPLWWSLPRLEELDATVNNTPRPEPKKQKDGIAPTYSSPTQSFIAKVASPTARRNVANMPNPTHGSPRQITRAPSPPPPEVDWTVAAHQLSKLLIPTDRQTMSCKHEDLSAEATRVRRDRQSILTPPTAGSDPEPMGGRMALRARKPAKMVESPDEDEVKKPVAKSNRRKTVAGASVIAAEKAMSSSTTPMPEPGYTQATKQSSRRLSTASNSGSTISEAPSAYGHARKPSNRIPSLPSRSAIVQSTRPDSSMSSRGHSIPPVVVKKARAPTQPKTEPAKTRVRRKSPLNDAVPRKEYPPILPSSRESSLVLPSVETNKDSEMDALTSGMRTTSLASKEIKPEPPRTDPKKTKLNLVTKSQREAKEKARLAAANVPLAPKLPVETKTEPATLHDSRSPMVAASETLTRRPSTPVLPTLPNQLQAADMPLPPSSPFINEPALTPEISNPADVFVPYQPEGPPASTIVQQDSLRWLPPNTATPANMKSELPVFTSTSAIPFGLNPNIQGSAPQNKEVKAEKKGNDNGSVWDVPETPRKQ